MADLYARRRMLLAVLRPVDAPATFDEILAHPSIVMRLDQRLLTAEDVLDELQGLAQRGYVTDMRPGRTPLYRLTAKGRGQIDREDDPDEYIWGGLAARYDRDRAG